MATGARTSAPRVATLAVIAAIGVAGSVGPATAVTFTPVGTVTEFNISKVISIVSSYPSGVAAGADRDVWFTQQDSDQVGRMTPTGKVTEFSNGITAASGPGGIAAGPDGNMWFTESDADQIGRITPTGKVTEFHTNITADSDPVGIAAGPDGNMWFTQQGSNEVGRITPTGKVTEFSNGITPGSVPIGIAAGPDGNMWFTEFGADRIGRITTGVSSAAGKVKEFSTGITAGADIFRIAAGPDGSMWFTEFGTDRIGRISTGVSSAAGKVKEFGAGITAGSEPLGIAAGADGSMWFTERSSGQVAQITPTGKVTEYSKGIAAHSTSDDIAAGPDGSMWFIQPGNEDVVDEIGRITTGVPSSPRAVKASPRSTSEVVTWAAPTNPGAIAISRYLVTATPGGHSCVSTGADRCTVHGLKNGTSYRFRVTAHNAVGTGPASAQSAAVIAGTPSVPRTLKVNFPYAGAASVTWRAPAFHGSGAISSYQIRWSFNNGHTWNAWANTKLRRHGSRTGLFKGQAYLVEVRARNHSGAGPVATVAFTQPH